MSGPGTQPSRREDILQALAAMLEASTSERITTAALARRVGFSEAALYRHFPSKAKMYEALLGFAEDTVFSRVNTIAREAEATVGACGDTLLVVLTFAERNPGITRMLCGDALHGEHDRLAHRAAAVFSRLESELKQQLRIGEVRDKTTTRIPPGLAASLMVNVVEGRLRHYVRSRFERLPTENWASHWQIIAEGLFCLPPPGEVPNLDAAPGSAWHSDQNGH